MMRFSSLVLISAGVLASSGCSEKSCTLAGCLEGIDFSLESPIDPGKELEISVTGEDGEIVCSIADDGNCDESDIWVTRDDQDRIVGFFVQTKSQGPVSVEIQVDGDVVWAESSAQPDFEKVYPNGKQCGGACFHGEYTIL